MLLDFEIKNELCLAMDVAQMLTSDLSLPPTVQPVPNDVYDGPAVDFSVRTHLLILALVLVGGQMEVGVWGPEALFPVTVKVQLQDCNKAANDPGTKVLLQSWVYSPLQSPSLTPSSSCFLFSPAQVSTWYRGLLASSTFSQTAT